MHCARLCLVESPRACPVAKDVGPFRVAGYVWGAHKRLLHLCGAEPAGKASCTSGCRSTEGIASLMTFLQQGQRRATLDLHRTLMGC